MSIRASLTFHFPSGLCLRVGTSLRGQQPGKDTREPRGEGEGGWGKAREDPTQINALFHFINIEMKVLQTGWLTAYGAIKPVGS